MGNLLKLLVTTILIFGISMAELQVTQASEQKSQEENVQIEQINESTIQLHLDDSVTFQQNENGNPYLVDNKNNKEEVLPSTTQDTNGNPVSLVYVENENGVEVQVLDQNQTTGQMQTMAQTQETNWLKCSLGTAGGMGTGGLAGAGVGSAVPVIGTVSGGVVGAVSAGMTGAAASCFD